MTLSLKWEFPGGKIEIGESEENCIIREIKEELNILIKPIKRLTPTIHNYPKMKIELIPYLTNYESGVILLKEHAQFKMLNKENLRNLDWAEADIPIINELENYE